MIPVVISENGLGLPVRAVDGNAPAMIVSQNGQGIPIVISENGFPFVVEGLGISGTQPVLQAVTEGDTAADALVSWGTYTFADGLTEASGSPVREMNNGAGWVPYDPAAILVSGGFSVRQTVTTTTGETRTFTSSVTVAALGNALWGTSEATWGGVPAAWGDAA